MYCWKLKTYLDLFVLVFEVNIQAENKRVNENGKSKWAPKSELTFLNFSQEKQQTKWLK